MPLFTVENSIQKTKSQLLNTVLWGFGIIYNVRKGNDGQLGPYTVLVLKISNGISFLLKSLKPFRTSD